MKKEIRMIVTSERCEEITGRRSNFDTAMVPVEIELDSLTPAARFIAERVTSLHILDEYRDVMDIFAESMLSQHGIDVLAKKSTGYIARMIDNFGEDYTVKKAAIHVTFPIYGPQFDAPEEVIEEAVNQLKKAGAYRMYSRSSGEQFVFGKE